MRNWIGTGWKAWRRGWPLLAAGALMFLAWKLLLLLDSDFPFGNSILQFSPSRWARVLLVLGVELVVLPFFALGYDLLALAVVEGREASLELLFLPFTRPLSVLLAVWKQRVVIAVRLLLFVVPGLISAAELWFYPLLTLIGVPERQAWEQSTLLVTKRARLLLTAGLFVLFEELGNIVAASVADFHFYAGLGLWAVGQLFFKAWAAATFMAAFLDFVQTSPFFDRAALAAEWEHLLARSKRRISPPAFAAGLLALNAILAGLVAPRPGLPSVAVFPSSLPPPGATLCLGVHELVDLTLIDEERVAMIVFGAVEIRELPDLELKASRALETGFRSRIKFLPMVRLLAVTDGPQPWRNTHILCPDTLAVRHVLPPAQCAAETPDGKEIILATVEPGKPSIVLCGHAADSGKPLWRREFSLEKPPWSEDQELWIEAPTSDRLLLVMPDVLGGVTYVLDRTTLEVVARLPGLGVGLPKTEEALVVDVPAIRRVRLHDGKVTTTLKEALSREVCAFRVMGEHPRLAVSPNGKYLMVVGEGALWGWDIEGEKLLFAKSLTDHFEHREPYRIRVGPARFVLPWVTKDLSLKWWCSNVKGVALTSQGIGLVVNGPRLLMVRLTDPQAPVASFYYVENAFLCWTPDSRYLVTDSIVWDTRQWRPVGRIGPPWGYVIAASDRFLITNDLKVWDLATGALTLDLAGLVFDGACLDERTVVLVDGLNVYVVDLYLGKMENVLTLPGNTEAVLSPAGSFVAYVLGETKIWHLRERNVVRTIPRLGWDSAAFDWDERFLALSFPDGQGQGKVEIWNLETATLLREYSLPAHAYALRFHPQGRWLGCLVRDQLLLIDLESGATRSYPVEASFLEFSPDGQWLATSSFSRAPVLWRVSDLLASGSPSQADFTEP